MPSDTPPMVPILCDCDELTAPKRNGEPPGAEPAIDDLFQLRRSSAPRDTNGWCDGRFSRVPAYRGSFHLLEVHDTGNTGTVSAVVESPVEPADLGTACPRSPVRRVAYHGVHGVGGEAGDAAYLHELDELGLRVGRKPSGADEHPTEVHAHGTADAHVLVDTSFAALRVARAIEKSKGVTLVAHCSQMALRVEGEAFAYVVDVRVASPILAALSATEVTGHDLVRVLASAPAAPNQRLYDTRIAAGLLHYATCTDDVAFDLRTCLSRWRCGSMKEEHVSARDLASATSAIDRLRATLEKEIVHLGLTKTLELEHYAIPGLVDATRSGLPIDRVGWSAALKADRARHFALRASLTKTLRVTDLENTRKVKWSLCGLGFEVLGTKTFELSPFRAEPVVADYLEYRRVAAFVNDLGSSVLEHLDHDDRVRATYDPVGAATGRISTRAPNVMGLPRTMRRFVQARAGHTLIDADYSAIELRIIAAKTKDPRLVQAFREGLDVHRMTAALVTGKAYDEITREERHRAKPVNFGWVFGMSINGFIRNAIESYGITFTRDEATEIRARYFEAYAGIAAWHEMLRRHLDHKVVLATAGRARRVPAAPENDRMLPFRILANSPVQGTAANGMKRALGLLARRLPAYDAHIVATVHDQVLVEVKEELATEVKDVVVATMKEGMQHEIKSVPIEVEAAIKKSWGG